MKRLKKQCEICEEKDSKILHYHHIIEQTEFETNNDNYNLAVICPTCHSKVHSENIKIIGVWPSTKPPGVILVYIKDGLCNFPGMENEKPYYKPMNKKIKI